MERPVRKNNRLPDYNYADPGGYFVTICTSARENLFWTNAESPLEQGEPLPLTPTGKIVSDLIDAIPDQYPAISVPCSVVMPNHVHMIIMINTDQDGNPQPAPSLQETVRQFKGAVTKRVGRPIWQKSFYEHVIRNRREAETIMQYIAENPLAWNLDEYMK